MTSPTMSPGERRLTRGRRRTVLLAATVLSVLMGALALGPMSRADAAEVTDGLVLWYKLDETSGTVAKDSSGKNRNGTVNGTAGWAPGEGLRFNGENTSVKVPDSLMAGMDSISVDMDVSIDPDQAGAYWLYGFGNTNSTNGEGNGYLFATGNNLRTAISTTNYNGEKGASAGRGLARGTFKRVTYTQTGTTGILYEDGAVVGRSDTVTVKPSAVGGGTTVGNHIGRSLYRLDRLFKGKIRDFRVYDRAITPAEVAELAQSTATAGVAQDKAALSLGDTSRVVADLKLPTPDAYGSTITWASSDPAVVTAGGKITRPALGRPKADATLTATLKRGAVQDTKTFKITVLAEFNDSEKVNAAVAALQVRNVGDVRDNLTLPTRGEYGTTITWRSDRPTVISETGKVTRPAGTEKVTVGLEATATLNGASSTRKFDAIVPPKPAPQALKGYVFSYFTGEGKADRNGEQLYLALSKGNNALQFRELNGGRPVLTSTIGDKGVRDPFIIRSPNGDKFYQIATDLRIDGHSGNPWDTVQRHGSKSIMVWESTDLVNWTDQRLVRVSPDTAGNTWAPEAFYDEKLDAYVVFWASKIFDASDPNHTGSKPNQMMYATTQDFHTFSEAKPYFDRIYGATGPTDVIDTTMIKHDGKIHRFTKDERFPSVHPDGKYVFQESGDSVIGPFQGVTKVIGKNQGLGWSEGPTVFKSNTEEKWYLFLDDHGNGGYKPFETEKLAGGVWTRSTGAQLPSSPRHGTVLPVTQAEYDRILRKYLPKELVDKVDPVAVRTPVGTDPTPLLPKTVKATFADDSTATVNVNWDTIDPARYAKAGAFEVLGTLTVPGVAGESIKARATVTVFDKDHGQAGPDVSGVEGSAIPLAGTATGEGARSWSVRPVSGVDPGGTCTVADPKAARTTLTCTDDGSYEVAFTVGASTDKATVTVTNAAPKIGTVTGPRGQVRPGATVTVTAPFTDPGRNDRHTCTVTWKDGGTSAGTLAGGTCTASHVYRAGGSYDVTVTVADDDRGTDSRTVRVTVSSAGTGGGTGSGPGSGTGGKLPLTGFPAVVALAAGVAFLVFGVVLVRAGRARRTRSSAADA